jgi:NADH-quinone oxidoreductase subunit G
MPTLTIDGQEITVDRGTSVLQAAQLLGIDIPTFCYHPGLSIPANCRMCLVDMAPRNPGGPAPKPIPACHSEAGDGMVIYTSNDRVKKIRQSVLEFILLNHPVDCPICDQAGECVLQDHYFKYSAQPSRLFMRKVHKPKTKVLGPKVILDAERCILCTRCVRFCDEIAKSSQLEVINRGEHSEITTFPGQQLDNPYASNVIDLCPVGALTSRDFRFRTRVWFLQSAQSVCPECSRGCKIRVDTFENTVRRYKPQHNPRVNAWWMCDEGRESYQRFLEAGREAPLTTVGGKRVPTALDKAVAAAAETLGKADNAKIGVVVTPWFTNEDAFVVARLLAGPLKGANVWLGGRGDGEADAILRQADKNPNRRGVTEVFNALGLPIRPLSSFDGKGLDVALVFGDEHAFTQAQVAALGGVPTVITAGRMPGAAFDAAATFLPTRLFFEQDGSFTNGDGIVQRIYRATKSAGTCKSVGWYAMRIAQALGQDVAYSSPLAIFSALAGAVPGFAGMSYAKLGDFGLALGEAAPKPAAPEAAATATETPTAEA